MRLVIFAALLFCSAVFADDGGPCEWLKPCKNGATCKNLGANDYECCCLKGWVGKNCDKEAPPDKPDGPYPECVNDIGGDPRGVMYFGTQNTTPSKRKCQHWGNLFPQSHPHYKTMVGEGNYCRNRLDGKYGRRYPWCYTNDFNKEWEYCGTIPLCSHPNEIFPPFPADPGCYNRMDKGESYDKAMWFSGSGMPCAKWENETHNYCRNPFQERRKPWCWTRDHRLEECDIEICALPPPVPGENVCTIDKRVSACQTTITLTGAGCFYEYELYDMCKFTIKRVSRMVWWIYMPYAVKPIHWLHVDGPQQHTSPECNVQFEANRFGQMTIRSGTCGWCFKSAYDLYMADVKSGAKPCHEPMMGATTPGNIVVG